MEALKGVTTDQSTGQLDEKYRVVAPETMQETFMSDSEDENGKLSARKALRETLPPPATPPPSTAVRLKNPENRDAVFGERREYKCGELCVATAEVPVSN